MAISSQAVEPTGLSAEADRRLPNAPPERAAGGAAAFECTGCFARERGGAAVDEAR